jgi:uncharacterized protein (TIGR03435 family)
MHEYTKAASLVQMKRILGLGAFFTTILVAQSFDAAVIKPSDGRMGVDMRSSPGGRVVATDITLFDLIAEINQIETYRVIGAPAWLTSDRFDITATAGPGFVDESQTLKVFGRPMPRNLIPLLENFLAERCSLKVHREQRPDTVYNLVQAKGGTKLTPSTSTENLSYMRTFRYGTNDAPWNGSTGNRATMKMVADAIARRLKHPVFDRTGLDGQYDFHFEYAYDDNNPGDRQIYVAALQETLGLRLESVKGTTEFLIIDSIQKPSVN